MRKEKDPDQDPDLWIMDPWGPKTCKNMMILRPNTVSFLAILFLCLPGVKWKTTRDQTVAWARCAQTARALPATSVQAPAPQLSVMTGGSGAEVGKMTTFYQGCGSGSGLDSDSIGSVDPDPDPGGQKWPTKVEIFHVYVLKCWMASFESWRLLLKLGLSLWRPRDR
jgi:hypothetical protein